MKNIKYLVFIFILLFVNVFYVYASCTDEEINALKEEVKNIKITYKHLGKVELEGQVYYNYFKLNASNLSDDFYVLLSKNKYQLVPVDGKIESTVYSGNWDFHVYSNKCGERIDTIDVLIPTFNMYSLNPLCEGVDGKDFELCGKYYEYYVGYEDFIQRVTRYRNIHNIGKNDKEEESLGKIVSHFANNLLKFVIEYKVYFCVVLFVLILLFILIIILRRRKKRGVLE